jgi:hypothetical protein
MPFQFQYDNALNSLIPDESRACAELARADAGLTMAQAPVGHVEDLDSTTVQVWLYVNAATRDADLDAGNFDNALATREVTDQGVVSTP